MELTGWAFFFAYIGVLSMVLAGWLLLPRASFIVTVAILVHKMGLMNLADGKGQHEIISEVLISAMVLGGLMIDIVVIRKFFFD